MKRAPAGPAGPAADLRCWSAGRAGAGARGAPGLLAVAPDRCRNLRRAVEGPGSGRGQAARTECRVRIRHDYDRSAARVLCQQRLRPALARAARRRARWHVDPDRRAAGDPHRRAGASGETRRHDPNHPRDAGIARVRDRSIARALGGGADLSWARGRAHPARLRPSAVRARAAHPGARRKAHRAHRHGVHGGAQHHPGGGDARLGRICRGRRSRPPSRSASCSWPGRSRWRGAVTPA